MARAPLRRVLLLGAASTAWFAAAFLAQAGEGEPDSTGRATRHTALVELGRRLFFDPEVSRTGTRACAACHDPAHGFSDPARVSRDELGRTRRHSQTLLDGAHNPDAHWDGEFASIEDLVRARIGPLSGRRGSLGHGSGAIEALVGERAGSEGDGVADVPAGPGGTGGSGGSDSDAEDQDGGGGDDDGETGGGGGGGGGSYSAPAQAEDAGSDGASGSGSPTPSTPGSGPGGAAPGGPSDPGAKAPATPAAPAPAAPAPGTAAGGERPAAPEADPAASAEGARPDPAPAEVGTEGEAADAEEGEDAKGEDAEDERERSAKRTPAERRAHAARLRRELQRLVPVGRRLEEGGRYAEAFEAAFGSRAVSTERIARAIAAWCRSIQATPAPVDRFLAGDPTALSASARRGLDLFRGKAGCAGCHHLEGARPSFTDYAYHNTGVSWAALRPEERGRAGVPHSRRGGRDGLEFAPALEEGRAAVSTRAADLRAFKTPTLRDVALRPPYMHDGSLNTLEAVVRYYAHGGGGDPLQSARVRRLDLSDADVADLVAFLGALTGAERPGLPARPLAARALETALRFVDADGRPLAGLRVGLWPASDPVSRHADSAVREEVHHTDADGWIRFAPPARIHTRLALPGGLEPVGGALIPDTCRKARIVLPVRGRVSLALVLPAGRKPPAHLDARHTEAFVLPGHPVPRTRLERTHWLDAGGVRVARFEGWRRADVPPHAVVRIPGAGQPPIPVVLDPRAAPAIDLTRGR